MRAVRIHAKQDMRTEQVPSPEPGADEVRLRVTSGSAGRTFTTTLTALRASSLSVHR